MTEQCNGESRQAFKRGWKGKTEDRGATVVITGKLLLWVLGLSSELWEYHSLPASSRQT